MDVNVLIVANGFSEAWEAACKKACIHAIREIQKEIRRGRGRFLVDLQNSRKNTRPGSEILEQYFRHLKPFGNGVGDAFFTWVYYARPLSIERVLIHPDPQRKYREFPEDPELSTFDWEDRAYVAVARAYGSSPEIVNAVDSDWEIFQDRLRRNGVRVRNLPGCPRKEG